MKHLSLALLISFFLQSLSPVLSFGAIGKKHVFTITGYYSPLLDQGLYLTGDYKSEIALNGHGTNGADGTPVFPGMIAAPRVFDFGTKIRIPGLGVGAVHDRGGAIVQKGERDLAKNDRLDVWMGYGMEGLRRALAFGVQHLECEIFASGDEVQVGMNFEVPPMLQQIVSLPPRKDFPENLARGDSGKNVENLQAALRQLRFFEGPASGVFDATVEEAVFAFQKKHFIVEDTTSQGAGNFGPQTRNILASAIYDQKVQETIRQAWDTFHFEDDFAKGAKNAAVLRLQEILIEQEFMNESPTGFFGEVTEEALTNFQLASGLIQGAGDTGAGRVGPATREKLNEILKGKREFLSEERDAILAYQKLEARVQFLAHGNTTSYTFVQK